MIEFTPGVYKCRNGCKARIEHRFHGIYLRGHVFGHPEINGKYGAMWMVNKASYIAECATHQQYISGKKDYINNSDFDLVEKIK